MNDLSTVGRAELEREVLRLRQGWPINRELDGALASLVIRIGEARRKHPEGANFLALVSEVHEVAVAMQRETPERVRDELLDVATVAIRLYLGERST